jgi:hypothetical protein
MSNGGADNIDSIIDTLHDLRERANALEKETAYLKGAIYMLLALLSILIAALLRSQILLKHEDLSIHQKVGLQFFP